jgi:hypothetical protein
VSTVYDTQFREACLRHRSFADPQSAEIISRLVLMLDACRARQIEVYSRATHLAQRRGQTIGEKNEYYVNLEQLETILAL